MRDAQDVMNQDSSQITYSNHDSDHENSALPKANPTFQLTEEPLPVLAKCLGLTGWAWVNHIMLRHLLRVMTWLSARALTE